MGDCLPAFCMSELFILPIRSPIRGLWIHLKNGNGGGLRRMCGLSRHHGKRGNKHFQGVQANSSRPRVGFDLSTGVLIGKRGRAGSQ